jgi:hypothetical protein
MIIVPRLKHDQPGQQRRKKMAQRTRRDEARHKGNPKLR